ncbi:25S rRNA (adenine645-N1)-methyltransferase [Perkinsus chesapeaki]|uniref:25S rRNA (Adenine645-N1)-methyltransferase n=1 Tax=Perkinsus chesapeaki TaxID=330153 RepID=A0A7J6L1H3_PERCH|nr:25S rRNA (adenine645-N1)-methyltransferase [Perkinsus chesapeaki]
MSSSSSQHRSSLDVPSFLAGIGIAAFGTAAITLGYRRLMVPREERLLASALKKGKACADAAGGNKIGEKVSNDKVVMDEQFVRNYQFFGEKGQTDIMNSRVVVVGLGGVGSHAAVTLARSGIGHMRLIDFDRLTVSSLNRHAAGIWDDVGVPKVTAVKKFIHEFNPFCDVDAVESLFKLEEADSLIADFKPDFVIDAIDNLPTKADLLHYCATRSIKVVSSGGAACKCDPTRVKITTLNNTKEDELCKAVKQRVRAKEGGDEDLKKIYAIYSTEKPTRGLLPLKDFQEENPGDFQTLEKFRVRILPVIAPLPAIFGNAVAAHVLTELAGQPMSPSAMEAVGPKQYRKMQEKIRKAVGPQCPHRLLDDYVSLKEANYIYADVCGGKSVISGQVGGMVLMWWKWEEGSAPLGRPTTGNMLVMTGKEAERHLQHGGSDARNVELYGEEKCRKIEGLLRKEAKDKTNA